jgi:eukaryotic-like serine/threonine-protein kinase
MDQGRRTRPFVEPPLPPREELLEDQSACWQQGTPLSVEMYLELYSNLRADRDLILDLICHEILLRERRGETPDPEEYLRRFPDFDEDLRTQFEVRQALAGRIGTPSTVTDELSPARTAALPMRVDGYDLLSELGRGGTGVVYLARHVHLKRLVALKMIQSPAHRCSRQLARFRGEAEVLASIQHPNIIQIYEVGECDGQPFLALEYLPGGGLDRRLHGRPQPPRQAAQLLRTLVRAVGAAHQAGVIHRDLKPANVLLTADGTPKITDFGLAKRLDATTGQTTTGDILGTPHYMAPEQAYGRRDAVGPWTDIYALGAILYELLTGRPPFSGATVWDTLEQMTSLDPVPPSRLQAKVPRDLEIICLKCLEKGPQRRYASAADLAEDLRRFLANEPIRARPSPVWERAWKWVRRRPALASLCGAGLLSAVVLLGSVIVGLKAAAGTAQLEAREAKDREGAALALADLKDELRQVEAACETQRWEQAASRLDGLLRHLDVAQQTLSGNAPFHELRARAEALHPPIDLQLTSRERLRKFRTLRTEAGFLVMGLAGTDLAARRSRAHPVVVSALALFGAELESGPVPALNQTTLTAEEQREVSEGCCEMLLGLAQLEMEPLAEPDPAQQPHGAEHALALLDRAAQWRASPAVCHARRARCLRVLGQDAEAHLEEERARACPLSRSTEFFLRGTDLYSDGDLSGALASFEKALSLEPNHAAAAYALALPHLRLRLKEGQPAAARAHLLVARMSLTACINQQPALSWPYLCRGFAQGELGETEAAEADYAAAEKILEAHPDEAARYALLVSRGALRIRREELRPAIDDLTEAIKLKPDDYQAHVNLARAYQLRRQDAEAVREMDQALAHSPLSARAALYRTRARLHQKAGRTGAAVRDLDEAARLEPDGLNSAQAAEDLLAKGRLLAQAGDYASAVEALDVALTARPDHTATLRARAEALLRLQRPHDALHDLNRLLEGESSRQPGAAALYRARAGIRAKAGDYAGAVEDYTQALGSQPEPIAYAGRGWSYLALDAPSLALTDFDRAAQLNLQDADSRSGLACARIKVGKYRDAVADAEQSLRLGAATVNVRYNAARVFAQASAKAAQDNELESSQRRELGHRYQDRAVALLHEALTTLPAEEQGRFWSGTVRRDSALNPIRTGLEFRRLAEEFSSERTPP